MPNARLMSDEGHDLIVALHRSGQRPLTPAQTRLARGWLRQALADCDKLREHVALLAGQPRCDGWDGEARPAAVALDALSWEEASAVAERGPDALEDDALARVLLSPFAL